MTSNTDNPAQPETSPRTDTESDPLADTSADNESDTLDESELPPQPSVTPTPADPWSDRQIYSTATVSTAVAVIVGLLVLRWLWKRYQRRQQ